MFKYIFFVSLFTLNCFGQNSSNFKTEISNLLESENVFTKSWATCNEQNSYFSNDTIYLSTRLKAYECSEFIRWDFDSKNGFTERKSSYVKGTHATYSINATTKNDIYKLKVVEENGKTIIRIYKKKTNIKSFIVLNFEPETEEGIRITLVRI